MLTVQAGVHLVQVINWLLKAGHQSRARDEMVYRFAEATAVRVTAFAALGLVSLASARDTMFRSQFSGIAAC